MERFDVIVIGAGPGGYVAAIRAAQLGFKVACVDAWTNAQGAPAPGGTCTNVGCIPSKALLQSTEHYEQALHHFAEHGIITQGVSVDVATMLRRKDAVVKQNNEGILYLFKKNKVAFFHGRARFAGPASEGRYPIAISEPANTTISATHVIIATGSNARPLPGVAFDEERILSNDGALRLREVPKRLGVIGAGVIGLEMGSVWRRLGAQVTMLEALPQFLPAVDEQIAKEARKLFTKQGLQILLGVKVEAVKANDSEVSIDYATAEGKMTSASFDRLIVAIGRVPNTEGLAPEVAGIQLDSRGFIVVDEDCRTSAPNVWAVGDVVRGPMLAHKAEDEGIAVAERIAGQKPHIDYGAIPWVIYTAPEIAWVGKTEQQLKAEGVAYRAGSFPFMANGRARALGNTEGLVKILAEAKTDRVLGMHAMGPIASELIAEGVMAIEFGASSEDIARICHAHPTLSEATREAALAVDRRALNF